MNLKKRTLIKIGSISLAGITPSVAMAVPLGIIVNNDKHNFDKQTMLKYCYDLRNELNNWFGEHKISTDDFIAALDKINFLINQLTNGGNKNENIYPSINKYPNLGYWGIKPLSIN